MVFACGVSRENLMSSFKISKAMSHHRDTKTNGY